MAIIRHTTLNLLSRAKTNCQSEKTDAKRAGWNVDYLENPHSPETHDVSSDSPAETVRPPLDAMF